MEKRICLVSCSGGKDSTATLLLALERMEHVEAVFADTGNEHRLTYEYLDYLEQKLKIHIRRLKADFSKQIERHRQYIKDHWEAEGINPEKVEQAVNANFPTGNPFLDLAVWKGRFPSSQARFCTEELKIKPLTEYALSLVEKGWFVESWQGVRAEESPSRANLPEREMLADGIEAVRPIHKWSVKQVFDYHREKGIEPNPLYKMGMKRVGCMPCIHSGKKELAEIALRFPEVIDRIESWEKHVVQVSKWDCSTFFPAEGCTNEEAYESGNIRKVVQWAKGLEPVFFKDFIERERESQKDSCSSEYGLCE